MKTIKAEILMIEGAPFPVIKEIYDPSNERRNGNITPEAPIVITGHNLDMLTWESTNLYLVSSANHSTKSILWYPCKCVKQSKNVFSIRI